MGLLVWGWIKGVSPRSLRLSQKLLYHLHLSWREIALILGVTDALQGREQVARKEYLLAEMAQGCPITAIGIVPHGQTTYFHATCLFHIRLRFHLGIND